MRWGVRDEATDDHMTTELCMKEIENCQRLSMGPNFVVRDQYLISLNTRKYAISFFKQSLHLRFILTNYHLVQCSFLFMCIIIIMKGNYNVF